MPYVVRGPGDLRALLRPRAIFRPIAKPTVLVRIAGLTPAECKAWQQRLGPLAGECGCRAGAQAIGLYLLVALIVVFVAHVPDAVRFPIAIYVAWAAVFLGGLIASALLGKLLGQLRAARRLHRACNDLEQRLRQILPVA